PALIASGVASAPSTVTALTVSSNEPNEIYPIAFGSPATVCITPLVLFWIAADVVVMSSSFSSTTPTISTNAPRVPDPSSRETTLIVPSCANAGTTDDNTNPAVANNGKAFNVFFINVHLLLISNVSTTSNHSSDSQTISTPLL